MPKHVACTFRTITVQQLTKKKKNPKFTELTKKFLETQRLNSNEF